MKIFLILQLFPLTVAIDFGQLWAQADSVLATTEWDERKHEVVMKDDEEQGWGWGQKPLIWNTEQERRDTKPTPWSQEPKAWKEELTAEGEKHQPKGWSQEEQQPIGWGQENPFRGWGEEQRSKEEGEVQPSKEWSEVQASKGWGNSQIGWGDISNPNNKPFDPYSEYMNFIEFLKMKKVMNSGRGQIPYWPSRDIQ